MINLFRAFSTTGDFLYEGAFIAKVKYQRFKEISNKETLRTEIAKSSKKLCIVTCSGYIENETVETLTVYLMMNATVKDSAKTETIEDHGILWRSFTKEEIRNFSHLTGDINSIHLAENPVVQGLFILKELCHTTESNEIEIKFVYPTYGNNPVYIKQEGNIIKGYSNSKLCFQATLF